MVNTEQIYSILRDIEGAVTEFELYKTIEFGEILEKYKILIKLRNDVLRNINNIPGEEFKTIVLKLQESLLEYKIIIKENLGFETQPEEQEMRQLLN